MLMKARDRVKRFWACHQSADPVLPHQISRASSCVGVSRISSTSTPLKISAGHSFLGVFLSRPTAYQHATHCNIRQAVFNDMCRENGKWNSISSATSIL